MDINIATVTIEGTSYLSQSRKHDEPALPKELPDAYDLRTWRSKLNTTIGKDGKPTVTIPEHGFMQALASAARYSKRKIPNEGKATWTAKFTSGVTLLAPPEIGVDPATVSCVTINANSDGIRGSGKRVTRRFPQIPPGWVSTFDVLILDQIITEDVFREMLAIAGLFIGIGRFRPEKGGTNGRFRLIDLGWQDNVPV